VAIKHTQFKGMDDFIVIPTSHPFLMRDPEAIGLTLHFLKHGRFKEPE